MRGTTSRSGAFQKSGRPKCRNHSSVEAVRSGAPLRPSYVAYFIPPLTVRRLISRNGAFQKSG
ncbi:hypothetical protein JCGZ_15544 [Jatropha curcas]|uniref:Uncharacterized protein n=1 Tax=Jatropha curcas TaxID=180498 RepID=A0A067K3E6_JATCU|nr:hypothetical protein JCGZ_15544 [Jatropha curcas]